MTPIKSRKRPVSTESRLSAAVAALALAMPVAAYAADDKQLPEVKVKAAAETPYKADTLSSPKFTEPLVDTPQTVTVIKKELIQEQGATTLTEALRNTPGVGTFFLGENGATNTGDAIFLRGFDTSSSIYVDGVRDLGSISRDLFSIEQIEVTKGPAGTDYGRSAPTGSINLVSKHAQREDVTAGTLALGTGNQKRFVADVNRAFGQSSAFRLNVMGQESGAVGRDEVRNNRWGIAPSLSFGLGEPTRLHLNYQHVSQNNLPDGGVSTIGLPGYTTPDPKRPQIGKAPSVDPRNFYGTVHDYDDVDADMFTAIIEHRFDPGLVLRNTSRWGRTHQNYMLTSFQATAATLVTPNLNNIATWTIARNIPTFKNQTNTILANQTNLSANFRTGPIEHDLSAGLEISHEKASTIGVAARAGTAWPAANLYNPNPNVVGLRWGENGTSSRGATDTAGLYAFDTLKFNAQWQATVGLRFDRYQTDFDSLLVCGSRGAPACGKRPAGTVVPGVDTSKSGNLTNWKLALVYKPLPAGSVYVNYATSQQPPGGANLSLSNATSSADNPIFDPQKAKTAEVGAKWEFLDGRLLATGALFRTEVTNELVQDAVDQQYYQNGKKQVQGVELGVVGQLTPDWNLTAGFTKLNTEVAAGPAIATDGSRNLNYTPDTAFTAWTSYRLPFNLTIGGGARYSGELKRGISSAVGTPAYAESYWVFDAMASYPVAKNLTLQLNVYNLLDTHYVAAINKSGFRYTPGAPLSGMLSAIASF